MDKQVYIVGAARTAIGKFSGTLANTAAAELGAAVIKAGLERANLKPGQVDEVIMGCVLQAGQGQNVARQAAIKAGVVNEKTAVTVNMVCGSGLRTVVDATRTILSGDADIIAAGGTENMSLVPYALPKARTGYKMGNGEIVDLMIKDGLWDIFNDYHMGITAENLVEKYGLTREELDKFSADSQNKAEAAIKEGKFKEEIVPLTIQKSKKETITFDTDEFPRFATTAESLGALKPAFKKDGAVTAGNASGINDGAAIVILASDKAVKENSLKPLAKIVSYGYAGTDPSIMGIGPVDAVKKALAKANWQLSDVDLIEANEAFAAQSLAVAKELGFDPAKVNVNGGAISLGHPIGASGTRILVTLVYELKRRGLKKGLATLCIGGGMGIAVCVETV